MSLSWYILPSPSLAGVAPALIGLPRAMTGLPWLHGQVSLLW